MSLKIACEKMNDKNFKNLHDQWYVIKFCVKLKKTVTEMKEMSDAAYTKLATSQGCIYHRYEFKSGRKSAELMDRPGAPMTVLTE